MLLVACEGDTNDITVVNSQEDVDPVEILSSARLDASSADGAQPVDAAITDLVQPVDALTDDTPQPIDDPDPDPDPDSDVLGDMSIPMIRWTGDLDDMEKERTIRILTVYGLGRYFLDGVVEKGMVYETGRLLEDFMNLRLGR